jgi:hypothetical protein
MRLAFRLRCFGQGKNAKQRRKQNILLAMALALIG